MVSTPEGEVPAENIAPGEANGQQVGIFFWRREICGPDPGVTEQGAVAYGPIGAHRSGHAALCFGQALRPASELEVHLRMNEPSDTSDAPARPQDYAGLRAESAELSRRFE
jgi:hypothetical protein